LHTGLPEERNAKVAKQEKEDDSAGKAA